MLGDLFDLMLIEILPFSFQKSIFLFQDPLSLLRFSPTILVCLSVSLSKLGIDLLHVLVSELTRYRIVSKVKDWPSMSFCLRILLPSITRGKADGCAGICSS